MLIDTMDIEFCSTLEEVLECCLTPLKKLLTASEKEEIKSLASNDKELKTMLDDYLLYHLTASAKACLLYVYPRGYDDYDDAFSLVGNYYQVVIQYALLLIREALLNNSLSSNGNGSIKSISSNGRSVTFMSVGEVQVELPQSLKDRLPLPQCKAKVRVW